jgi:hypothetical protein
MSLVLAKDDIDFAFYMAQTDIPSALPKAAVGSAVRSGGVAAG